VTSLTASPLKKIGFPLKSEMENPKVVMLGDAGVGKSSILCRISRGRWEPDIFTTVGNSFIVQSFRAEGEDCPICIWDTPGQDQYESQSTFCVRDACACVVLYDITRQQTYQNVERHISRYLASCQIKSAFVVIAANKSDMVAPEDVQQHLELLAKLEYGPCVKTFIVSAKSGEQIQEMFQAVAGEILRRHLCDERPNTRDCRLVLNTKQGAEDGRKGKCC
jgi:small GTP-binding protein